MLLSKFDLKLNFNKWFGNFVTFKWWNELWLEEALGKQNEKLSKKSIYAYSFFIFYDDLKETISNTER